MQDIIRADVLAVAPDLSSLSDQYWVDLLEYVNEFDFTCLDSEQTVRMARIFLAAHYGDRTKRAATGIVGPVVSEAAGGVRRSYGWASTTQNLNSLNTTPYGLTLESILMMSGAHGPFVI